MANFASFGNDLVLKLLLVMHQQSERARCISSVPALRDTGEVRQVLHVTRKAAVHVFRRSDVFKMSFDYDTSK